MPKRAICTAVLFLLLTNMLVFSSSIRSVNASGTIYIRADGSIDPPTAPVSSFDNVTYELTDNITTYSNKGIVLERSNIILDGAGLTLDEKVRDNSNGIYLAGVSNVTVRNMSITSFHNGVCENGCANGHVEEMNLSYNDYGIYFQSSSFSVISGNNLTENTYAGIWLELSKNNLICKNGMANFIISSGIGGIKLQDGSDYNNITENYLKSNSVWNIYIENSHYNNIFHNSIFGNYAYSDSSDNPWDDGYPSGGNYWSNHRCTDFCSGPSQNEVGSDGIGDTPCFFDVDTIDHYPLMKPYPWGTHDIGITNVAPSRTMVGQGFALSINVTVFNYGTETEYFNATAYANATSVSTCENVLVEGRNSTAISFIWDTMDFALGNYTISASADPVPDEVDNTDNTRADGTVQIAESVSVSPSSVVMDVGQFQTFGSNVTGGTSPYTYQWYLDGAPISGATSDDWIFTPTLPNSYAVYVQVTDNLGLQATSNTANVTVRNHDVAVANVTPCKTVVYQGYSLRVTVTAADLGDCSETFNFTLCANATAIASQNVTLSSGNFTTVTITWKTSGFACGNYILSAFALPVSGETNTSDNGFTGNWVTVTRVGDITGPDGSPDGKCDMRDLGYVARRFLCKSGDPIWDPNADIDDDGKVDMKDIGTTARHFT
jgi:parallel beta-helix repeat protein